MRLLAASGSCLEKTGASRNHLIMDTPILREPGHSRPELISRVVWHGRPGCAAGWLPLLGEGVEIEVPGGLSLRAFMQETLGLGPASAAWQGLAPFLDGSPVHDLDTARVHEGSLLVLGSTGPGPEAAGRGEAPDQGPARITIRLFPPLADVAGPELLRRGVLLSAERLREHLFHAAADLRAGLVQITADGLPVSERALCFALDSRPRTLFRLVIAEQRETA